MKLIAVVLCGGSGTRLWPLSRKNYPKQFAPLFDVAGGEVGGETLFRRTMDRVGVLDCHRSIVICNNAHRFFVADALRAHERDACTIVVEPSQRNTAPAATLAALSVNDLDADASDDSGADADADANNDALLLIMPSDHVIDDPNAFATAVAAATPAACGGQIVIFGVVASRSESEYGYIRTDGNESADAVRTVVEFCEKPDEQIAAEWIARGDCFWNSGIFLLKASVYLNAIGEFEPDIRARCAQAWKNRYDDLGFTCVGVDDFARCRSVSIDYAIMERANNVKMLPLNIGWNDLGSWNALGAIFPLAVDNNGSNNRVKGDVLLQNASGNIIYSHGRLVSVVGMDDCIIADTPDALLVAARKHAPDIKELVESMRAQNRPEANEQRKVYRPWGYYESILKAENFQVKRITVNPGHGLSLQMHHHRSEHWVVVKGKAQVTRGDEVFILAENESTYIPLQVRHRLENIYAQPVRLIEVQCGDYLGEDDIVRFDDRYGRVGQSD